MTADLLWHMQICQLGGSLGWSVQQRYYFRYQLVYPFEIDLMTGTQSRSGGRLNIKILSYQYRDSHVKDKTCDHPIFNIWIPMPGMTSLYWERPWCPIDTPRSVVDMLRSLFFGRLQTITTAIHIACLAWFISSLATLSVIVKYFGMFSIFAH